MTFSLEYHIPVRHSIPASLALLALPLAFVSASHAQINGAPASVTSQGFGGRAINGPPASVTSVGPRGLAPNPRVTFTAPNAPRTALRDAGWRLRGDALRVWRATFFSPLRPCARCLCS